MTTPQTNRLSARSRGGRAMVWPFVPRIGSHMAHPGPFRASAGGRPSLLEREQAPQEVDGGLPMQVQRGPRQADTAQSLCAQSAAPPAGREPERHHSRLDCGPAYTPRLPRRRRAALTCRHFQRPNQARPCASTQRQTEFARGSQLVWPIAHARARQGVNT